MKSIPISHYITPIFMTQKQKYCYRTFLSLLLAAGLILLLTTWSLSAEAASHWKPDYAKLDLHPMLSQSQLSSSDYDLLYAQTGLSRSTLHTLLTSNRTAEILSAQDALFADIAISCESNSIISKEEHSVDSTGRTVCCTHIPELENGDILFTSSSHTLGWRNGHVAIVVDAASRITLESVVLGENSCLQSVNKWETYPTFLVLRLKNASCETRSAIASNAQKLLFNVPYGLLSVHKYPISDASPSFTHCSHLVWYAYEQAGYDLDSDGGLIVTPNDIAESPLLEIVQVYGINPQEVP